MKVKSSMQPYQVPTTLWLTFDDIAASRLLCNSVSIPDLSEMEGEFDWV